MAELDIARLREVAEAATPGPWRAVEGDLEGKPPSEYLRTLLVNRVADGTSSGRLFLTLAPNGIDPEMGAEVVPALTGNGPRSEANAAHIATFDPPTVLALLDRLARVEALAEEWTERAYAQVAADKMLTVQPVDVDRAMVPPHWRGEAEAAARVPVVALRAALSGEPEGSRG